MASRENKGFWKVLFGFLGLATTGITVLILHRTGRIGHVRTFGNVWLDVGFILLMAVFVFLLLDGLGETTRSGEEKVSSKLPREKN